MKGSLKANWLPLVDSAILQIDEIPLLGNTPSFDWSLFAENLKKTFQCKELVITPKQWLWRESRELFEGLGSGLKTIQIAVSPLEGTLHWVMPEEDIKTLMSLVLGSPIDILSDEMQEGFCSYIAAEVLHTLEDLGVTEKLPLRLLKGAKAPNELSLCLDIIFEMDNKSINGRLFLSSFFRKAWKRNREEFERSHFNPSVSLNVSLCMGHVLLSLQELLHIQTGDLLILQHSTFNMDKKQGPCFLSFNHSLLFNGTLQGNKIKITEYLAKLEEPPMTTESSKEKEPPKTHAPADETHDAQPPAEDAEDTSLFLGEDEEFFMEDEELSKVLKEELVEQKAPVKESLPKQTEQKTAPSKIEVVNEAESVPLKPEDIPLIIKIEIASLSLPAKKVLELHPGNELSLDKEVDNSVRLIVNGKCIGKGELIQIGEVLGVRILAI
ncbi:MAG: type III secretion system cytoplasmic ring protein SctQ [Chlamydiales bacterium]|nr:type III secretion system cytoplasmic ring protein SctQ [Chlamydiales bacterium]